MPNPSEGFSTQARVKAFVADIHSLQVTPFVFKKKEQIIDGLMARADEIIRDELARGKTEFEMTDELMCSRCDPHGKEPVANRRFCPICGSIQIRKVK